MFSDTTRFYETTRVEWRDGFVPSQPKHVFVEVRDLETGRDAFGIGPDQDAAEREAIRANEQAAAANSPQGKIVKQSQSALTLLGFDVGPADGQLNQATIDAIRSYQSSYKLLATGQPSEELVAHMRENL